MTRIVELIYTQSTRGKGTDDDPVRLIEELWAKDGTQVAWADPYKRSEWVHWERLQELGRTGE